MSDQDLIIAVQRERIAALEQRLAIIEETIEQMASLLYRMADWSRLAGTPQPKPQPTRKIGGEKIRYARRGLGIYGGVTE